MWKFLKNLFKKKKIDKYTFYVRYKNLDIKITLDEEGLPYLIEPPAGVDLEGEDIIEILKLVGKTLEKKYLMGEDF